MLELTMSLRRGAALVEADVRIPGGVTALFGRSGVGKSSLIHAVAGLLKPTRGRIVLRSDVLFDHAAGINLPPERRRLGVVFQDGRLFPHRSVRGNLRYGVRSETDAGASFHAVVSLLDLEPLLGRHPSSLSGGERQRVAIGRALMTAPRLLLMDEPLASLDAARKAEVLPYLGRLTREFDVPVLYVTHSVDEILDLADHLLVMDDGRVIADGEVEAIAATAAFQAAAGPRECGVAVSATVVGDEAGGVLTRLAFAGGELVVPHLTAPIGATARVRIQPQNVGLALTRPEGTSFRNILPAVVVDVAVRADGLVDVRLDCGVPLLASVTPLSRDELGLKPGLSLFAMIKTVSVRR